MCSLRHRGRETRGTGALIRFPERRELAKHIEIVKLQGIDSDIPKVVLWHDSRFLAVIVAKCWLASSKQPEDACPSTRLECGAAGPVFSACPGTAPGESFGGPSG